MGLGLWTILGLELIGGGIGIEFSNIGLREGVGGESSRF